MTKSEYIRYLEQTRHDLIESGDMSHGSLLDEGSIDWIEEVYNMDVKTFEEFYKETLKGNE